MLLYFCRIAASFNKAINRGAAGVPLTGENYDFSLDTETPHGVDTIWDASCRIKGEIVILTW